MASRRYHPWFGQRPAPSPVVAVPPRLAPKRPSLVPGRALARFGRVVVQVGPNVVVPHLWSPRRPVLPPVPGRSRAHRGTVYVAPRTTPSQTAILSTQATIEPRGMIVRPL